MKKTDIETYYERGTGALPSVNVKVDSFGSSLTAEDFNCDEHTFEKAMGFALDLTRGNFWRAAQELAEYHFGVFRSSKITVYSGGRSGGHLLVDGLDDVSAWSAPLVSAWGRFVKDIKADIAYRCLTESIKDMILGNRWNEEGAERYNFYDKADGTSICISEMKTQAAEAGFAPVIRA